MDSAPPPLLRVCEKKGEVEAFPHAPSRYFQGDFGGANSRGYFVAYSMQQSLKPE